MKKVFCFFFAIMVILSACSSNSSDSAKMSGGGKSADMAEGNAVSGDEKQMADTSGKGKAETNQEDAKSGDRMVIRQAELEIRVKDFGQAQKALEIRAGKFGGYIVDSSITKEGEGRISGTLTIRVPAAKFESFLHEAQNDAAEVLSRNVRGEDVTEQYVDLESRLRSREAVEARLLDFMKNAKDTEDLLKISSDLGAVQDEIEQIKGKMKYFENQSAMSTITISMYETKIVASSTTPKELNTWDRTKKQFLGSVNLLLSLTSGLVVFFIGNLPVLLLLAALVLIGFLFIKKSVKKKADE